MAENIERNDPVPTIEDARLLVCHVTGCDPACIAQERDLSDYDLGDVFLVTVFYGEGNKNGKMVFSVEKSTGEITLAGERVSGPVLGLSLKPKNQ